jgi:peptide-methionine (S)-S-oxide reductase
MKKNIEIIYLAGGCYWGLEHLINEISGVSDTEVGFSGGHIKNVCYKEVTKGGTGHAETVKVEFDNLILPLDALLEEFFKIHNPTTINQQGNDMGSQYRSAIFYTNPNQKKVALKMIKKINDSGKWGAAVVTSLEQFVAFYPAEESHQKYLQRNPSGYTCHFKRDISFE